MSTLNINVGLAVALALGLLGTGVASARIHGAATQRHFAQKAGGRFHMWRVNR